MIRGRIMLTLSIGLILLATAIQSAQADGMIVPVRSDLRVRGSWAVKYHHVSVTVRNQIASVNVDQQFVNIGRGMIEVEYLFPVPPHAAIDSMTLVVDGKEYAAKLLKADDARRIYEDIVRQKKDPALLEYVGYGLYKTRAFPLQPGKPCRVIITYKTVCHKDQDLVEVWYPLNTEKYSAQPIESVRVKVDLKSKTDIGGVYSPTHSLNVKRIGPQHVVATYKQKNTLPTIDFKMYYQTDVDKVGSTFVTHQPVAGEDGYFMMLVSPNPRDGGQSVTAKNVVMVFDHSGSMSEMKIDQAKTAMRHVLNHLNPQDYFNVVAYNDSIETFFDALVPAGRKKINAALEMVDRLEAAGGTNIHEALLTAMKQLNDARHRNKRPSYVIFMTDGQATVGKTEEKDILDETRSANLCKARLFTFGVGYQPNIRLLDKLAMENYGRSDYVKPNEPIESKIASLYNKIKNPVMTNLAVKLQGVKLRDSYPRQLRDLFDDDQIVVVGRYDWKSVRDLPKGDGEYRTTLVASGNYLGQERAFEYNVSIHPPGKDLRYGFVEKLWAVRRVGYLMDQIQLHGKSQEVIDELVRLSKKYGIMTPYTSFLADERTQLSRSGAVRHRALEEASKMAANTDGIEGQRDAVMRSKMAMAEQVVADSAVMAPRAPGDPVVAQAAGSKMYGQADAKKYDRGEEQYLGGVRNIGNEALYRRGQIWIASNATQLDPDRDKDKIQRVRRFSKEYFELVKQNTAEENQLLAQQQAKEQLLIVLRSQAYLIE